MANISDSHNDIPSPEEFEAEFKNPRRGALMQPLVSLAQRLRLKKGVGAAKKIAAPSRQHYDPYAKTGEAADVEEAAGAIPKTFLENADENIIVDDHASSAQDSTHSPRKIVFREGIRKPGLPG